MLRHLAQPDPAAGGRALPCKSWLQLAVRNAQNLHSRALVDTVQPGHSLWVLLCALGLPVGIPDEKVPLCGPLSLLWLQSKLVLQVIKCAGRDPCGAPCGLLSHFRPCFPPDCWPNRFKGPSIPNRHINRRPLHQLPQMPAHVIFHTWNPSPWEVKAGRAGGDGALQL